MLSIHFRCQCERIAVYTRNADFQVLFKVEGGMVDTTVVLFAMYYVLMYKYPASLNNVFAYLQTCILQILDGQKLPMSVITFVN